MPDLRRADDPLLLGAMVHDAVANEGNAMAMVATTVATVAFVVAPQADLERPSASNHETPQEHTHA